MKKAFTIMEVLVAIFIFVVILGIVVVDYGKAQKINEFRLIALDLEDSIRFTQTLSITGQKVNEEIPDNGYGIVFRKQNDDFIIYGDNIIYIEDQAFLGFMEGDDDTDLIYSQTDFGSHVGFANPAFICNVRDESEVGYYEQEFELLDVNFSMPKGLLSFVVNGEKNEDILSCTIFLSSARAKGKWLINIISGSGKIWSKFLNN
ncbi:MAG: prepilin-type N-terminal cleavage/methylation domain-containing protein [Patescibacteria group bacterium]|nr:prepilin-type N-terminal cleavage/methylation domain-containing protein [Patescibacteria group bacterium]